VSVHLGCSNINAKIRINWDYTTEKLMLKIFNDGVILKCRVRESHKSSFADE